MQKSEIKSKTEQTNQKKKNKKNKMTWADFFDDAFWSHVVKYYVHAKNFLESYTLQCILYAFTLAI